MDPYDVQNPNGDYLEKVIYPDKYENMKIIGGTKFGELLFKCDFYLKKMSLGINEDCKTLFLYPEEL